MVPGPQNGRKHQRGVHVQAELYKVPPSPLPGGLRREGRRDSSPFLKLFKRGDKKGRKKRRKKEKQMKNRVLVGKKKENGRQKKSTWPQRFQEAFQIGLGKAFKIDGTLYTPVFRNSQSRIRGYLSRAEAQLKELTGSGDIKQQHLKLIFINKIGNKNVAAVSSLIKFSQQRFFFNNNDSYFFIYIQYNEYI